MLKSWILVLLLVSPLCGVAVELERECIDEPVFEGSVCVYQANPHAQKSVLLVHGVNGSGRHDWEFQIPALAKRYHVIAIDLPGFGASSKGRKAYTPENYARLLAFIAERYINRPYAVVGHSMGAAVSLRYAARHARADLERLVLIDSAGILHGVALSKALAGSYASQAGSSGFSAFVSRMTGKLLEGLEQLPLSPDDVLDDYPALWMRDDPASTAALAVAAADMSHDIAAVDVPTLVVWGKNDTVAPLRTGRVLEARLSNAHMVVVPEAAHVPMRDQPEQVNALISAHLLQANGPAPPIVGLQKQPGDRHAERVGRCRNQRGATFTGRYRRIELRHCDQVVIRHARVDSVYAFESRLKIDNSEVVGSGTALEIEGSEVEATASRIHGKIGIASERSRLDLAGVELGGRDAAVVAATKTNIVFSVSRITSPQTHGYMHGFRALSDERL